MKNEVNQIKDVNKSLYDKIDQAEKCLNLKTDLLKYHCYTEEIKGKNH